MTIYNLSIFNRQGQCLFYESWQGKPIGKSESDQKLIYGLTFSLKQFCENIVPSGGSSDRKPGKFTTYKTSMYKLHYFETPTGLRFILQTDPGVNDHLDQLQEIWGKYYVDYVMRNPLYNIGTKIDCEQFCSQLDRYVKSLPAFN